MTITGLAGCSAVPPLAPSPVAAHVAPQFADEPIQPLPSAPVVNMAAAALGAQLFTDARLSKDGSISCATCHPLGHGGMDGEVHSRGVGGRLAALNTPTVFNVVFNFRFNWAGSYTLLEEELDAPLSRSMQSSIAEATRKLAGDAGMVDAFKRAFPDGLNDTNLRHAIAEFERTLVTPNARFDRYLKGDSAALTDDEKAGYARFKELGCASCHQGANAGGNMFQRMGVVRDYFAERKAQEAPAELGRYNDTSADSDRHVFRVPSLRNVALTAPYFHDGSARTLEQAVSMMARYQLGRSLDDGDATRIAAFLRTLTGEYTPLAAP